MRRDAAMQRSPWSRGEKIAVIALGVTVVGILLSLTQPEVRHFFGLGQAVPPPLVQSTATSAPSASMTAIDSSGSQGVLIPAEVQKWCYIEPGGGTCDISRFVQFRRADGTILPYAVQMLAGEPVEIKIPAGFTAQVWDCYHNSVITGPQDVKKACTMTVARGTSIPD